MSKFGENSQVFGKQIDTLLKKDKGNCCTLYSGIEILNTSYKLYSRIFNSRFKADSDTLLLEEHGGCRIRHPEVK